MSTEVAVALIAALSSAAGVGLTWLVGRKRSAADTDSVIAAATEKAVEALSAAHTASLGAVQSQVTTLAGRVDALEVENRELRRQIADAKGHTDTLERTVSELTRTNADLTAANTDLTARVAQLSAENASLREELARLADCP